MMKWEKKQDNSHPAKSAKIFPLTSDVTMVMKCLMLTIFQPIEEMWNKDNLLVPQNNLTMSSVIEKIE